MKKFEKEVQDMIFNNLATIKLQGEAEDGKFSVTMDDLVRAIGMASESELESFLKPNRKKDTISHMRMVTLLLDFS